MDTYHPRSSRNCSTCRAYKRRCDKQQPHCGQCLRQGESCPGYRDEWELVFRDQTTQTIRRSNTRRRSPHAPAIIRPNLKHSREDIGVNFFLHNFISNGRGCLNYIPTASYCDEAAEPMLLSSMAAVGLMALAKSEQRYDLAATAQTTYSEAVTMVNSALRCPEKYAKDATLMSVVSLGVFEEVSDYQSWLLHVQGAAALVAARGQKQFSSPISLQLFNQVRTDLITSCVNEEYPIPDAIISLQQAVNSDAENSTFWVIGVMGTRCANLLTEFRTSSKPRSQLLEDAVELQRDFQSILPALAAEEPYTTAQQPAADPDLVYNGRVDLYKDVWAIRLWNNCRNLLMIVCRVHCALLEERLKIQFMQEAKLALQESMNLLSALGDGILASFPQAMDFKPPNIHCNVSGGYLLAPRLAVVGQSPTTSRMTRDWIIWRLRDLSNNARIPIALRIIQNIRALENLNAS